MIAWEPRRLNHEDLLRAMKAVIARPEMYGASAIVSDILKNALETIEDMSP